MLSSNKIKMITFGDVMIKKRGLGLGLNQLLSDIKNINHSNNDESGHDISTLIQLSPDLLRPGKYQPRHNIDEETLVELANSVSIQGVIQPILVRPIVGGSYEIIAGERRWRAAQIAKLTEVPVIIRKISDEQTLALSLIENIQREDLNAVDTAIGLQRLIDEFSMTHSNVATAVGKSRASITNLLRLLELPEEIKVMVQQNQLEMGHARALLTLDRSKQIVAANAIIAKKLSVRATENLVNQLKMPKVTGISNFNTNAMLLQKQFADKLTMPVKIYHTIAGKGRVVIKYNSLLELESTLQRIK
jgi:ParB family transcriptional regulator, chromosome partitioning protein